MSNHSGWLGILRWSLAQGDDNDSPSKFEPMSDVSFSCQNKNHVLYSLFFLLSNTVVSLFFFFFFMQGAHGHPLAQCGALLLPELLR